MPTDLQLPTLPRVPAYGSTSVPDEPPGAHAAQQPAARGTLRILVINWQDRTNPHAGGAEVHLHETFGRLAARGHEVVLLVSGWSGAPRRELVDGMDVHRVGNRYTFPALVRAYYRRHLRREPFDLVVEDLNKLALGTPRWVDAPVLLLVHHLFGATAFSSASLPVAGIAWAGERTLGSVYRHTPVQAVSRSTADDLVAQGLRREQIQVVHNGIDLDFYHPAEHVSRSATPSLVYVGRLQRYKRVDLILRALAFMKQRGVQPHLWVVGEGSAGAGLQRLARRLGVADQVEFTGYVSQERKRALLRTAWVHVLTSEKEGWGLSVMEAAACGTPTVGSASPGLLDSVVSRETGLLLPHGDWVDLGSQLVELLGDPTRLETMGRAARHRAARFSWDRAATTTEDHLLQVLGVAARRNRSATSPAGARAPVGTSAEPASSCAA